MKQPKSTSASKKKIESLILVTEKNRQHCIVLGRICHVYQKSTTAFTSMGSFDIRPRITAGWHNFNGVKFKAEKDETREEYMNAFKGVLDLLISQGTLYIDTNEKLIKYDQK